MTNGNVLGAAAAHGIVAAMAMTGMRRMTKGLGLLRRDPPEEVVEEGLAWLAARIPPERRDAVVELAHWLYGAAGGAAYGILPNAFRRQAWAGPATGWRTGGSSRPRWPRRWASTGPTGHGRTRSGPPSSATTCSTA